MYVSVSDERREKRLGLYEELGNEGSIVTRLKPGRADRDQTVCCGNESDIMTSSERAPLLTIHTPLAPLPAPLTMSPVTPLSPSPTCPNTPPPPTVEDGSVSTVVNGAVVTVSAQHQDVFQQYRLYTANHGITACPRRGAGIITLHKLVFPDPVPVGMVIDHIDRNPFNNVVSNLRLVTPRFNCKNRAFRKGTNAYKGVHRHGKSFRAMWGKPIGTFKTARQAKVIRIVHAITEGDPDAVALETDIDMSDSEVAWAQDWLINVGPASRNAFGQGTVYLRKTGRWEVQLHGDFIGTYPTRDDADQARKQAVEARARAIQEEDNSVPIPCTEEGHAFLTATNGSRVLVDDDIYRRFYRYRIWIKNDGYAVAKNKLLHHYVVERKKGQCIDHKNHDRLDNRRSNLRATTASTNNRNRSTTAVSGYLGVYKRKYGFQAVLLDTTVTPAKRLTKMCKSAKAASDWRCEQARKIFPQDYSDL